MPPVVPEALADIIPLIEQYGVAGYDMVAAGAAVMVTDVVDDEEQPPALLALFETV